MLQEFFCLFAKVPACLVMERVARRRARAGAARPLARRGPDSAFSQSEAAAVS